MADGAEKEGVARLVEFDFVASAELSHGEFIAPAGNHTTVTSISKAFRMDHDDDDGAPTSLSTSTKHHRDELHDMEGGENRERVVSFDSSAESTPRKSSKKSKPSVTSPQTPPRGQDLSSVDMKSSWDGSSVSAAGLLADPAKIAKEREKEERVKQARERLMEERQKKLEELREQQKMAQENREKQLETRRRKIEDLRKRDIERRIAVEERRRMKEQVERARRESILQKAEERVARYEAWKAGGRKGVFGGSDSPPQHLSMSTSVLYTKSSREYSSMSTLHPSSRLATSMGTTTSTSAAPTATHYYPRPTIVGHGINPLALASMTASLPSPVRMRESKAPRKPRPASVASCMPSFIGGESAKSRRSKSTDRPGRDRSRTRQPRREEARGNNIENGKCLADESGEKMQDVDVGEENGEMKEKKDRVSLSFSNRLSKHKRKDQEQISKESAIKKDGQIVRQLSPRKAYSTSNLATMKKKSSLKEKQSPTHLKDSGPKVPSSKDRGAMTSSGGPLPATARSVSPARRDVEKPTSRMASPSYKGGDRSVTPTPFITPPPSATSTPTVPTPSSASLFTSASTTPSQSLATSFAEDGTIATRAPVQDISADEYKARLAEKRRQARERAEKEAEEERKRQEESRLAEEERLRKEEEEESRFEEESLRLAEEAQRVEEERLQRAIEAEEKRRKEETERMEQEKRSKEEAERKALAESERLGKEKQERARKEEEERLERKKKLEMIMKRVKTDTESQPKMESPTKPATVFPEVTHLSSSQSSPEEEQEKSVVSSELSDEEAPGPFVAEGSAVEVYSADMTMSFIQDFEETDMMTSGFLSTSAAANNFSAGNVLDGLSFHSDDNAGSMPCEPERTTIWSEVAQRLDEERQQKKERTERRVSAETNSIEILKQDQFRKEDEERLERKKKLEMIMKRVKTDTESQPKMESPTKPATVFPQVTHLSSSQSSPEEEQEKSVVSSELSDEEAPGPFVAEGSAVEVYSADMTMSFIQDFEETDMTASTTSSTSTVTRSLSSGNILDGPSFRNEDQNNGIQGRSQSAGTTPSKPEEAAIPSEASLETKSLFKSPLLQHLVENKGNDSSGPKFKSPLLQNLLGKTKVGARVGLSASVGDLSPYRERPSCQIQASPSNNYMTLSASSLGSDGSPKDLLQREQSDRDKPDVEQSQKSFDHYMFTNGVGRDSDDTHFPTSLSKSSFDSSPFESTKLFTPMRDSALGSSIEPYGDGMMSQSAFVVTNGHGKYLGHGMEDSSINLYCVEEGMTKSSHTTFETLNEPDRLEETSVSQSDGQFQDLIDFGGASIRTFEGNNKSDVTDYLS